MVQLGKDEAGTAVPLTLPHERKAGSFRYATYLLSAQHNLIVAVLVGGETTDNRGQTVIMDDMEMLQGRRWRSLQQKMPEARSRFSLQRIPTRFFFAKK